MTARTLNVNFQEQCKGISVGDWLGSSTICEFDMEERLEISLLIYQLCAWKCAILFRRLRRDRCGCFKCRFFIVRSLISNSKPNCFYMSALLRLNSRTFYGRLHTYLYRKIISNLTLREYVLSLLLRLGYTGLNSWFISVYWLSIYNFTSFISRLLWLLLLRCSFHLLFSLKTALQKNLRSKL